MLSERALIQQIRRQYGATIDLKANPDVMVEIIQLIRQQYASEPGTPGPGTQPMVGRTEWVTNEDIMKELLKIERQVRALSSGARKSSVRAAATKRSGR
jgi:hypothetical protein